MKPNTIYCGDAGRILSGFPDASVDLIYADPPFFTNKPYEIIWKDGYEIRAFEDRWKGGIENYIAWMDPKLRECHRVLKSTGSMYLHCDWHANAHLRILMDRVFGEEHFRNELVWFYPDSPGRSARDFPSKHDTIFRYGKSDTWTFNDSEIRIPILEASKERYKTPRVLGGRTYVGGKAATIGKIPEDVWRIPVVKQNSGEAMGYPTQKPQALLQMIIQASSNPTDIVLDPFCGCGTTIVVAHRLGRRWIGVDVSPTACKLMATRMRPLGIMIQDTNIIGLPRTVEEVKSMQPFEFQNWVLQKLGGRVSERKVGDMGIDGWLWDKPVQVKQSESIGRIPLDNFQTALRRVGKKQGIIVAFSFGRGAFEEAARTKLAIGEGFEIELLTVEDLINRP